MKNPALKHPKKRFKINYFIAIGIGLCVFVISFCSIQLKPGFIPKKMDDDTLLELVQRQTFSYFWDFAHPVSGLSRERSNVTDYGPEVITIGGSGFGVMSIIVATNRKWITRDTAVTQLLKILRFLQKADSYHGIFPHWLNGETRKVFPFSSYDDGADLVETSYLFQGLLCVRQYFNAENPNEIELRNQINNLWHRANWNWHTNGTKDSLYWHWSPKFGWKMNFPIKGYNECLITYILAASSPSFPIDPSLYHNCWTNSSFFKNGKSFYNYILPLGFDFGGPLFFAHYSFLGLDPRGLKDRYSNYWLQNQNHSLINFQYCQANPKAFPLYGSTCWGLTASDTRNGYSAHSPTNDLGVISPTAALSSFPYTPKESMDALRFFYYKLGNQLWSPFGFKDAFSTDLTWVAESHLAIDQGPIIIMIENYRTALLWDLFMSCPEIQNGLKTLNFTRDSI
ncbi:MAG: beta-glucosidase [Saprospiraceae bacterium]|nr:beta-glucosidase [Saprospiraceae bacterium]